jgi:bifunctional non-homologous end joining protein LigD
MTGSLDKYAEKRHFDETPEPGPEVQDTGRHRFVVQEHHASNLHWDFRLEMDGVLKSWAVPKGPPEAPGVRRLAVQVEDHPVSYINFEGEIAEGQYGAGEVKIWDSGAYDIEKNEPNEKLFTLHGHRLDGRYALIHTKDKQWIMLKRKA